MTINDPIADMLTRIRNALMAGHAEVSVPRSKIKVAIAQILKDEGYIEDFDLADDKPVPWIHIQLKYWGGRRDRRPVITGLERVSKPGCRRYVGCRDIPRIKSGMGIAILSTPDGVLTDQEARRRRVGGELLCYVW